MAVMATQHSEGVAFEQKTMPVPSSDKMALDIDINGNSSPDDTKLDTSSPSDFAVNQTVEISSSNELFTASAPEVNGDANNIHALASNKILTPPSTNNPLESQLTEESSVSAENLNSSQLLETNTTTSEVPQFSASPVGHDLSPSLAVTDPEPTIQSAVETVINSALEDTAAASTVPPVVEVQESNIRDTTSPHALATEVQNEPRPALDVNTEPELPVSNMAGAFNSIAGEAANLASEPTYADLPRRSSEPRPLPESVVDVAPTSSPSQEPVASAPEVGDTTMTDAPQPVQAPKVSREREDDDETEPSAKRTKTEEDTSVNKISGVADHDESQPVKIEDHPISHHEVKEFSKILKWVGKQEHGKNFRLSVKELWPTFAEPYAAKISNQIDLGTMEKKLKAGAYPSISVFQADIQLLFENALLFNGPDHDITKSARWTKNEILERMGKIPPEPVVVPKVPKKQGKRATPAADSAARASPARRQSRSGGAAPGVAATPTFALDPTTNTPLIRRDSTKGDGGRPKREIHPPKNKDLPYTSTRPKNKKFSLELRFCEEVLAEMKKPKYQGFSSAFMVPVDPVALNIPHYFTIVKTPMDMSTVEKRLRDGTYQRAKDFESDVKLIFSNCYKFNPQGNPVRLMGQQFEQLFNTQWAKKDDWIETHAPAAATPSSNGGSDEEDSEDEEEEQSHAAPDTAALTKRLLEEQTKLIDMMGAKIKDQAMIEMQQDLVTLVKSKIDAAMKAPPKKVTKKTKTTKPPKKTAPSKKGGQAASKKSAPARHKYLGTLEKETISAGITALPDDVSGVVLEMIKMEQPDVDAGDDGCLELDIDLISTATLWKIYDLVMKHAPEVERELRKTMEEKEPPRVLAKPVTKKKNKPMSKNEQERKIEHLQNLNKEFERSGSGSQEPPPLPTVEQQDESSGDEDSDSEEE